MSGVSTLLFLEHELDFPPDLEAEVGLDGWDGVVPEQRRDEDAAADAIHRVASGGGRQPWVDGPVDGRGESGCGLDLDDLDDRSLELAKDGAGTDLVHARERAIGRVIEGSCRDVETVAVDVGDDAQRGGGGGGVVHVLDIELGPHLYLRPGDLELAVEGGEGVDAAGVVRVEAQDGREVGAAVAGDDEVGGGELLDGRVDLA